MRSGLNFFNSFFPTYAVPSPSEEGVLRKWNECFEELMNEENESKKRKIGQSESAEN